MLDYVLSQFTHAFLSLGSTYSIASLLCALLIAIAFILLKRPRRNRDVKLKVMLRALFPSWYYRGASFKTDLLFMVFSVSIYGILFGWALISSETINRATAGTLVALFGAPPQIGLGDFARTSVMTAVLFLAYEIGYWTQHCLMHRIPFLWEFHKVHHTAEVLSPMTNFRIHPVDAIIFHNVLAVMLGTVGGALSYGLGSPVSVFSVGGTNILLLAGAFLLVHLQHSHVWIAVTGPLGRVVMSPAHHQYHHSSDPQHFNKNFGSCLAVWDWMFGTLQMPTANRQRLTFGVSPRQGAYHTLIGGLFMPIFDISRLRRRPAIRLAQSQQLAPIDGRQL